MCPVKFQISLRVRADSFLAVLRFNDKSTLMGILCRLLEKGRKEIEEIVEEMKERDREVNWTGMKGKKQKK